MATLNIEIIEDSTDTGGFGVEGYEVILTSNLGSVDAFINTKNCVTTSPSNWLHKLFKNRPYNSEYIKNVNGAVQKAFKPWSPETKTIQVNI